jgi:hypothetical protein
VFNFLIWLNDSHRSRGSKRKLLLLRSCNIESIVLFLGLPEGNGLSQKQLMKQSNACYHDNFPFKIIKRGKKHVPLLALNSSFVLVIESRWPAAASTHVAVISSDMPHGQTLSAICIRSNPFLLHTSSVLGCEKYRVFHLFWKEWAASDLSGIQSRTGNAGIFNLNPLFALCCFMTHYLHHSASREPNMPQSQFPVCSMEIGNGNILEKNR